MKFLFSLFLILVITITSTGVGTAIANTTGREPSASTIEICLVMGAKQTDTYKHTKFSHLNFYENCVNNMMYTSPLLWDDIVNHDTNSTK